nr:RNA-directed DNA polymerase, eukaryota [Tanacetum cinerariifolium]
MFIANLSSADPVYDETCPSYDLDILSEYVKDNAVLGVQSNVYFVPNDAYMMIYNDMYIPHAQSVSKTSWHTVVDNSLTAELATYKEQVKMYERRARLTLLKAVFRSMPIYHMTIFKVPMLVLQRMESIRCHFFNGNDLDSKRAIHDIHGVDGRIGRAGNVRYTSIWYDIIKEMDRMPRSGIESEQWDNLLDSLEGVMLNPSEDRWS